MKIEKIIRINFESIMVFSGILLALCVLLRWDFSSSSTSRNSDLLPSIYSVEVLGEFTHYHKQPEYSKKPSEDDSSYRYNKHPFTQGLLFLNSTTLVESAGLFDGSFIKLIEFPSMKDLQHKTLDKGFWGEGIAVLKDHIYQLTWTSGILIVYSLDLSARKLYSVPIIGWGLTSDNESRVWATSGVDELYELNIPDFDSSDNKVTIKKVVKLTCLGKPMTMVNEMEYIPETKTIWGNIFQSQMIVEFSPETGECVSIANLKPIYDPRKSTIFKHVDLMNDVLNGIAYHPSHQDKKISSSDGLNLLVTGKRWPRLYKIRLNKIPVGKALQDDHDHHPPTDFPGRIEEYFDFYSSHSDASSSGPSSNSSSNSRLFV